MSLRDLQTKNVLAGIAVILCVSISKMLRINLLTSSLERYRRIEAKRCETVKKCDVSSRLSRYC